MRRIRLVWYSIHLDFMGYIPVAQHYKREVAFQARILIRTPAPLPKSETLNAN